jgi:hypothetical protein
MHAYRKPPIDTNVATVEPQRFAIYEILRDFRTKRKQQPQLELVPKQKRASTAYADVPNDLDRIAFANTEKEVLEQVNEILGILHRSRRAAELPHELRMVKFSNLQEVRVALKRLQGNLPFTEQVQWESDALNVLRIVLVAADKKVRQLRRQV